MKICPANEGSGSEYNVEITEKGQIVLDLEEGSFNVKRLGRITESGIVEANDYIIIEIEP